METALRQAFASTSSGFFPLRIADLMRKHGLGRDRAGIVARRLARIARNDKSNYERARAFHAGAAAWFAWAGDSVSRYKETLLEVETLLAEADQLPGPGGLPGMQAADRLERALRALRTIPKTEREDLGVGGLAASIARRIREAGAAALGEMRAFSSGPIDLTTAATESRDRVKDLSVEEALLAFVGLSGFASFNSEREEAEKTIKEHPLQSIFGNVHFSTDGRVIYRSAGRGGTPIYGVDPALWRQMIQRYSLRINFLSTGALWPAFQQITNQHHLGLSDFLVICAESGVVPVDRITQFARGLFYGYCGDFSSAMQLLVPQIENTVRNHLANAGDATSTVTPEGLELEVGLSALMDRQNVEEVFGEDLAFEIRALLCGPLGPNLRNEVAHGLINDATAGGAYGLYCWWFALRLVYLPFWNRVHDADAADGREPRKPEDFRDEMAEESPVE
ncbi:MAG TPA: DUF4209 domain-containing protein [Galbitalea sp.]|nr:DUF4209 domain-containing protein [Galbitalea sp.]